ncbi:MAG: hypothetical protein IJA75_02260 [Oscillospiraceae bacterium]|nr:hypothetical protein [Oscillospiraceae bacterium]
MASQNFRSAFNGFNREDVVRYLEYLNSKHSALINQLTEEAENLRQKLKLAADAIAADSARAERITALEEENAALKAQLEEAKQGRAASDAARQALEAECIQMKEQLANQPEVPAAPVREESADRELEAYRRAERTERLARERADQLYRRTNGVLADATVKVDQVAADIGTIADQVMTNLQQLQQAVTGSKQALQEAAELMYTIRPEED